MKRKMLTSRSGAANSQNGTEMSDGVTHRPTARLSTTTAPSWVQLLVLGPAMFGVTDGCLRRSATADTRTTPMPLQTTTPAGPSHRFPCNQEEYSRAQCLNGGTCYAVMIQHKRHAICNCPPEWAGRRCEEGYIDPDILGLTEDNMRTASIAAGVSVCILVIFVLLLAVYVYLRYKRKQRLLSDREFEATAEELYRRPFSGRSSIVESSSRPGSIRRGKSKEGGDINMNELAKNGASRAPPRRAPLAQMEEEDDMTSLVGRSTPVT